MTAAIIGISLGLLIILIFSIFKHFDKKIIYGLILSGIGFLYVGFAWTDLLAVVINSIQAVLFFLMAYYGIKKNIHFLIAGYFLHGLWDISYHLFQNSNLIPPHYDLFCISIDFIFGFYLLLLVYRYKNMFRA
jgi:Family of unknown function (DUF6010)